MPCVYFVSEIRQKGLWVQQRAESHTEEEAKGEEEVTQTFWENAKNRGKTEGASRSFLKIYRLHYRRPKSIKDPKMSNYGLLNLSKLAQSRPDYVLLSVVPNPNSPQEPLPLALECPPKSTVPYQRSEKRQGWNLYLGNGTPIATSSKVVTAYMQHDSEGL